MDTTLSQKRASLLFILIDHVDEAKRCFEQTGLKIVTAKRYLGGLIGDETTLKDFVHKKNQKLAG